MKASFIVVSIFCGIALNHLFAQVWQDSLRIARSLYQQQKYTDAYSTYKSVKKIAPKKIDLSNEIAQAAYKAQLFDEAEKMYDKSGTKFAPSAEKAKTYHNLGNSKLKQKKYPEAIEAYRESLRNNPSDEETRYNLAKAMLKQKNEQKKENQQAKDKNQQSKDKNQQSTNNKIQKKEKENNQDVAQQKSKLNDKKTDRMLDELMKKEMETKKKMEGNKAQSSTSNSGIDW